MRRLAAISICGLALLAYPVSGEDYRIVLKNGKTVTAKAAPTYKSGAAYFYAAQGNTYTALRESEIDRAATEKANAPEEIVVTQEKRRSLRDLNIKISKESTVELHRLEKTKPKPEPATAAESEAPAEKKAAGFTIKITTDAAGGQSVEISESKTEDAGDGQDDSDDSSADEESLRRWK